MCGRVCALDSASVRGFGSMKKASLILVIAIMLPLCLFAEDNWIILQHNINVTISNDCWFEYWVPSTETPLTGSVAIASVIPTRFATLAIHYQGKSTINLSVGFTPLFKLVDGETLDSTTVYGYTMEILKPGDNEALVDSSNYYATTYTVGGVGYPMTKADIYSRQPIGSKNGVGKYAVADFRITLNDSDPIEAGNYRGFLVFYQTTL